ncbi:hypothetical protein D3C71_1776610 [compost metagenome]
MIEARVLKARVNRRIQLIGVAVIGHMIHYNIDNNFNAVVIGLTAKCLEIGQASELRITNRFIRWLV